MVMINRLLTLDCFNYIGIYFGVDLKYGLFITAYKYDNQWNKANSLYPLVFYWFHWIALRLTRRHNILLSINCIFWRALLVNIR